MFTKFDTKIVRRKFKFKKKSSKYASPSSSMPPTEQQLFIIE